MKKLTLFIALLVLSTFTYASGGSKDSSWQTIDEKVCVVFVPTDFEEKCEDNTVDQSGQAYLCSLKVVCNEESEDD